ncbi:hypothetical protein PAHAL_2G048200 [Panicum hallii]|uniref:Uncharacterized protein n=1 Tax=Panicum hallii TaxID=206008 RepID=A0A2T8KMV9_9POAL|nr:hypothetical protein PAHAL_2G048200 [Panicum hallii]
MGKVSNAACCLLDIGVTDGADHITSLVLTCNSLSQHVWHRTKETNFICVCSLFRQIGFGWIKMLVVVFLLHWTTSGLRPLIFGETNIAKEGHGN